MTSNARRTKRPALGLIVSEWIKFWTLTSNKILVIVSLLWVPASAVLSSIALSQRAADPDPSKHIASVTAYTFLDSILWLQLLLAVIAVLFATAEYSSGQIQVTLLATPTRISVPIAKAVIIALLGFLVGVIAATGGLLVPAFILPEAGVSYAVTFPNALGLVVGAGAYLAGIGVISMAMGVLIRNLVVAIIVPLALFTVLPAILGSTGNEFINRLVGFFPTIAGRVGISTFINPGGLTAFGGFLVLAAWATLGLFAAGLAYQHRDA